MSGLNAYNAMIYNIKIQGFVLNVEGGYNLTTDTTNYSNCNTHEEWMKQWRKLCKRLGYDN